jgi:hypothetical protein
MERKGNPPDGDIVLLRKPFNTPGNEIAPGSDVIGENLHNDFVLVIHETILLLLYAAPPLRVWFTFLLNQLLAIGYALIASGA